MAAYMVHGCKVNLLGQYGQFVAGPERIGHFLSEKARFKVRKARLYVQFRSIRSKFDKEDDFIWG